MPHASYAPNVSVRGDSRGFQGAAIGNFAENLSGVQLSAISNIAYGELNGFQAGLANYSGKARGVQLGLVNIAREHHGAPIGLINAVGDGMLAFNLYASDTSAANFAVKMGSRYFYSILGYGIYPVGDKNERRDSVITGLGGHIDFHPLWLEIDLVGHMLHRD